MTSQRHGPYDSDAMQNEYLEKLGMRYPQDEDCNPYKQEDYRPMQEKPKIEKMGKLKRELKFIERNVQRVRTKIQKLQHNPTLTPSTSTVDL